MRLQAIALVVCAGCGDDGPNTNPGDGNTGGENTSTVDATVGGTCDAPMTFADGITPTRTLHVAAGAGGGGDGSVGNPFGTIGQAAGAATPGTQILLGPGNHTPDQFVSGLHGTAQAPIWIGGTPGQPRPVFAGGAQAMQLVRAQYVVIHDIEVTGATANGINLDDGNQFADELAAHHVLVRNVYIHDIGTPTGNLDCLKVSGINHLSVYDSDFVNCGGGGSGIDHVGCHGSVVARNVFSGRMENAVQSKGGALDHDIRQNRVHISGSRAFNIGGSTDLTLFRPPLSTTGTNAEARRIRVYNNIVTGLGTSATPFAFVGCIDCLAANNFARGQQRWHVRILQETPTQMGFTFEPSGNGRVVNNTFVFSDASLATAVNVGGNTAPATFTFTTNAWYASDAPAQSAPMGLPTPETGGVSGMRPDSDMHVTDDPNAALSINFVCAGSPEAARGTMLPEVTGSYNGVCRGGPPSDIGPLYADSCTI